MVWFHDPFTLFHDLQRELGRIGTRRAVETQPRMNVQADAESLTLVAELAGYGPEDVEVRVEQDVLVVEGFRTRPTERDERTPEGPAPEVPSSDATPSTEVAPTSDATPEPARERRFRRAVRLPFRVDVEDVTAKLEHGLLTVRAPRRAADRPRVVPIHLS